MNIVALVTIFKQQFPKCEWTVPPDLVFGILTTNFAFRAASKRTKDTGQKTNPNQIAVELCTQMNQLIIEQKLPLVARVVGCYINLDIDFTSPYIAVSLFEQTVSLEQTNKKIMLEYVGVNVAKPMHAGHLRNANLGESLKRILKLKYSNLVTDHHWGDWGVQFGIILWAWKIFAVQKTLEVVVNEQFEIISFDDYQKNPIDILVKLYVWGNQQSDIVENWKDLVRAEHLKLEQGDSKNRKLWQDFVLKSKLELRKDLELLGVGEFDYEQGESYYECQMKELWEFMDKHYIWQIEGQGRYIDLEDLAEKWVGMPTELASKIKHFGRCYLVQSKNGYTTYPFRDVAARLDWAKNIGAETMITLTDHTQKHNFDQAFAIISYLASLPEFQLKYGDEVCDRLSWHNLVHVQYGFLTLPEGKMSTRKGNFLTAQNLINQVVGESKSVLVAKNPELATDQDNLQGELNRRAQIVAIAALKWYDLARDSLTDVVLDIPKILSFEGNTGVYQLYTVARLNSILSKVSMQPSSNPQDSSGYSDLNDVELLILKKMILLPLVLETICVNYKPHLLCTHLFELATMTNSWYAKHSVSMEKNLLRQAQMLSLCSAIKNQLVFGLDLLAIETLETL